MFGVGQWTIVRLVQLVAGYFLYVVGFFLYVVGYFLYVWNTFDVTRIVACNYENEVEWFHIKRRDTFSVAFSTIKTVF